MLGVSGSGRWLLKNGKGLSMGWMGAWRSAADIDILKGGMNHFLVLLCLEA